MMRIAEKVGVPAILVWLLLPVLAADKPKDVPAPSQSMSIWQARRTVVADYSPYLTGFRFTADGFECDSSREHFKVDMKSMARVSIKLARGPKCVLTDEAGKGLPPPLTVSVGCPREPGGDDVATALAAALNRLRTFANDTESPFRNFPQQAAAWRALPAKPPIPEEARVQRLLAEDAVKQNKPQEALNYYEAGLELHPTWPQGYFNAALIAAELDFYTEAVEHMQAYLELVPDAPDAQAARDQLVIWRHKAGLTTPQRKPDEPR